MDSHQAPSVSIDGVVIRRIREENRLTQLYVAKVVGVTTDTVSRWENNRYPTIRRDNALKLAEALEVDLEEILQAPEAEVEVQVGRIDAPTKRQRLWWLLLLPLAFLLFQLINNSPLGESPSLHARRLLPAYAAPGSQVLVRVEFSSEKPLKGAILREQFPQGWTLVEAEPAPSSLDNLQGVARWIFRKPDPQATVFYRLEVPRQARIGDQVELKGELIANPDGQRMAIPLISKTPLSIQPLHWADSNGNQRIDDLEILEVSDIDDQVNRLHLGWDLLEEIWDVGGYRWESKNARFVPQAPSKTTPAAEETSGVRAQ